MGKRWQHFWSKKVAAGTYAGFMIAFLTLAIPQRVLADDRVRLWLVILAVGCGVGATYELWLRREPILVKLLLEVTAYAQLPSHSRGVVGVYALNVGSPSGIGSMGTVYDSDRERALDWTGYGTPDVIKCELTSFSDEPLVRVQLDFGVTITKAIRRANLEVVGGNTYSPGEVLRVGIWDIMMTKLLPGVDNKLAFYLCNREENFVTVSPPSVATFEFMGDAKRRSATLPEIYRKEFLLFGMPRRPRN